VLLDRLADQGVLGGLSISGLTAGPDGSISERDRAVAIVVAVTERRTRAEIDHFATALGKAVT
jgi:hypothetical protein